ncbi:SDR family oxidoreductase [Roseisalinus antarcticus]|uniref:C-factor n=1 Tax=Roseisalinus antarcticus TaxID=254357 RepID=A0A1Y5TBE3_9RHOB|nr:SDR family oxidoreductase [Roseisalinus antarcticus]SLN56566.1 C-factor [Roseisalinus antarcticus]
MSSILISGATRGIGLELARQFGADGWDVIGTARDPGAAGALRDTGAEVLPLEATDAASIAGLARALDGRPLDVVIANAGISGDLTARAAQVTREDFLQVVGTNTFAPLALVSALKPNLLAGTRRLACAMSSLMSSVTLNDWGTQFSYRASKSGLNAVWRSLSLDWKTNRIACVLLRPGFVATEMTGGQGMPVADSVAGLKTVVEGLGPDDTGRLIGFDGKDLPW